MSTARFNTLQNAAGSKSVPVDTVVDGSAKAWVNFNGTGTVAIRAAFNVSSITDNGTGNYTVNFTTAMTDANYAVTVAGNDSASPTSNRVNKEADTFVASSFRVRYVTGAGVLIDGTDVHAAVFR